MNKHFIILINGKRRSGKGLLTEKLKEKCAKMFGDNIHVLSFAQPIKDITKPILNKLKWDGQDKEIVRPLWISMGEVGRNIDANIWCAKVLEKIVKIIDESIKNNKSSLFLIDDLRFPNELDYFIKNIKTFNENIQEGNEIKAVSIRIEKFMDAEKFVNGVDDNSTEISFDKFAFVFDYVIPQDTLIDRNWEANFDGVNASADTIIRDFIK